MSAFSVEGTNNVCRGGLNYSSALPVRGGGGGGGTKLILCTFSRGRTRRCSTLSVEGGLNYVSALSVEGTRLCLCTFSRGELNYVSALSVEGD